MIAREHDEYVPGCAQCAFREYSYTDECGRVWHVCYRDECVMGAN